MDDGLNYLQTFNPVESKHELLEHTLVGRKNLVDRLEELVIESTQGGNKLCLTNRTVAITDIGRATIRFILRKRDDHRG